MLILRHHRPPEGRAPCGRCRFARRCARDGFRSPATYASMLFGLERRATVYLSPAPLYHAAPLRSSHGGTQRLGGTVVVMARFDALSRRCATDRDTTG